MPPTPRSKAKQKLKSTLNASCSTPKMKKSEAGAIARQQKKIQLACAKFFPLTAKNGRESQTIAMNSHHQNSASSCYYTTEMKGLPSKRKSSPLPSIQGTRSQNTSYGNIGARASLHSLARRGNLSRQGTERKSQEVGERGGSGWMSEHYSLLLKKRMNSGFKLSSIKGGRRSSRVDHSEEQRRSQSRERIFKLGKHFQLKSVNRTFKKQR